MKLCNENYNKIELGKHENKKTHLLAETSISFFELHILPLGSHIAAQWQTQNSKGLFS